MIFQSCIAKFKKSIVQLAFNPFLDDTSKTRNPCFGYRLLPSLVICTVIIFKTKCFINFFTGSYQQIIVLTRSTTNRCILFTPEGPQLLKFVQVAC